MNNIQKKALRFIAALSDVYCDEESRELNAFGKMSFSEDISEDFTAMLVALSFLFEHLAGHDGDLIDFTHILNKLAIQYIMEAAKNEKQE